MRLVYLFRWVTEVAGVQALLYTLLLGVEGTFLLRIPNP